MILGRIVTFVKSGIWEAQLRQLSPVRAFFVRYLRVTILAAQGFLKDECLLRASALTYYSLLSVIPLLALVFGIAKGFGLRRLVENQVIKIAVQANWPSEVVDRIIQFSRTLLEQTKGGLIAGIGVLVLLWAVLSILGNIEDAFNHIWDVKKPRTFVRKYTDYLSIMLLAPILLIVSSSTTVLVTSKVEAVIGRIALLGALGPVILLSLKALPYLFVWILLILNYVIMPNTKVRLKSAVLAGIAVGTIYQLVQWAYISFQIGASRYGAIYGSFAALPLFLMWLELSWMIVLFGAEIAFAHENAETFGFHPDFSKLSVSARKLLMLRIIRLLVQRFSHAAKPMSANQIAYTLEIPVRLVGQLLYELTSTGLVVETVREGKNGSGFQPGEDIDGITLKVALEAYEGLGEAHIPVTPSEDTEKITRYLKEISDMVEKAPANVKLKEI